MNPIRVLPGRRTLAWSLSIILGLSAGFSIGPRVQAALLNLQVKSMQEELAGLKMKTVCVGRFLIDVPHDAEVSYRGAFLSGWNIWTNANETDAEFEDK